MAVDERSRHDLFTRIEEVLGKEHASVLMEHLPPLGWGEVVTKRDLEAVELRMLATFRGELNAQTRVMMFGMSTAVVTVAGLAFAAATLV